SPYSVKPGGHAVAANGFSTPSKSTSSSGRNTLISLPDPAPEGEQIGGGLRGSTHHAFRSSWIGREVCFGAAVVGVGAVADRGVVGAGLDDTVDRARDRAWPWRGGDAFAVDASSAGARAGAFTVAVVCRGAGGDFARSGGW